MKNVATINRDDAFHEAAIAAITEEEAKAFGFFLGAVSPKTADEQEAINEGFQAYWNTVN